MPSCVSLLVPAGVVGLVLGLVIGLNIFHAADRTPNWLRGWGAENPLLLRVAGGAVALASAIGLVNAAAHPGC